MCNLWVMSFSLCVFPFPWAGEDEDSTLGHCLFKHRSASPGNLVEMQILGPHTRPINSESLELVPSTLF